MNNRILKIEKETDHRFLNYYTLRVSHRNGSESDYFMTSRAESVEGLRLNTGKCDPDGVAIYAVYGEKRDQVVLVRQYRYPLGGYVYEFPAGLVEKNENFADAAVREMFEETGLLFEPVQAPDAFMKARFMTVGITDETCATVYGYASGRPSVKNQEDTEDIEVVIADKKEIRRILKEENVAIICAYQLMHFLRSDGNPFDFLEEEGL